MFDCNYKSSNVNCTNTNHEFYIFIKQGVFNDILYLRKDNPELEF